MEFFFTKKLHQSDGVFYTSGASFLFSQDVMYPTYLKKSIFDFSLSMLEHAILSKIKFSTLILLFVIFSYIMINVFGEVFSYFFK